jgi:hypothetical protein
VSNSLQTVPVIANLSAVPEAANESIESPLLGVVSKRTESEVVMVFLGENVEAEQTREIIEDRTDDLPEALKRGILSSLNNTRKLLRKERIVPQESFVAGLPRETTTIEEHGSLVITPLSDRCGFG